jgi:methylphosphotriester-DNA--protein-cysteine methyltransferase
LIFHSRGCWYTSRLKRPPRMYLARTDAFQDGARPCLRCKP